MQENPFKTLEDEFAIRHGVAEYYFDRIDGLKTAIDGYLGKLKEIKADNSSRTRGELLSSLLKLEFEIESVTRAATRYAKLTSRQLLLATTRAYSYDVSEKLDELEYKLVEGENQYGYLIDRIFADDDLHRLADQIDNEHVAIFWIIHSQIPKLRGAIGNVQRNFATATAEQITQTWGELLSRYEAENTLLYDSFFDYVIDPQESLRDLRDEREGNEVIKLWHKMPDPYKFVNTLRKQAEKVELDLLPVFDYAIKYKRLQEMRQQQPMQQPQAVNYHFHDQSQNLPNATTNTITHHNNEQQ